MRRFIITVPGYAGRKIVGRGVAFTDDIVGVRWRDEPRMTLVWMDEEAFAAAIKAGQLGARLQWLDRKVHYS